MPSTYTVNLGIEKPATGEQSGTWGDTTNVNFDILDQAINGAERVTLTSAGSSGSPNALNITNGATSDGRNKWIEFYSSGDLGGSAYVQLVPNDAEKIVFIRNSLASSRSVLLFQGTYNSGRDLEIPAGVDMVVKFDGGGASAATVTDVFTKLRATEITTPTLTATTADINGGTIDNSVIGGSTAAAVTGTAVVANTSLNIAGDGATVTGIKDEDNMASNSATKLATQQSIKAYVDSQVGTVDTWAEVLANGATSGSTNPEVTAGQALKTNTINETSAGSGVTIDSVLLKDDVVNATDVETSSISANDGTASATIANTTGNFTVTNLISNSVDIGGGAIDGTVIGGASAAAGSFTTLGASGAFTGTTGTFSSSVTSTAVNITSSTPIVTFIETDQSNKQYQIGSFGSAYAIHDASNTQFRYVLDTNGNHIFNEGGVDADFRVESDTNTHGLFLDASSNTVGVGLSSPTVVSSTAATSLNVGGIVSVEGILAAHQTNKLILQRSGNVGAVRAYGAGAGDGIFDINVGGGGGSPDQQAATFQATTIVMNDIGADRDFRVESDSNTHAVFVDASTNRVGILNNNPAYAFHVDAEIASSGYYRVDSSSSYNGTALLTLKRNGNTTGDYLQMRDGSNNVFATFDEGGIIFNEVGGDTDFRVESNGNANMFFVDGGNNQVGVGTASALGASLNVLGGITNSTMYDAMVLTGGANSTSGSGARLYISGTANDPISRGTIIEGKMVDNGNTHELSFYVSGNSAVPTRRMTIGHSAVVINEDSLNMDFRVESDSNSHMLFVDAGNNKIGINRSAPAATIDIRQSTNGDTDGILIRPSNETQEMVYSFLGPSTTYFAQYEADSSGSGANNYHVFTVGGTATANELLKLSQTSTVFNEGGIDRDFRVESDGNANMLFVDGGENAVAFGTNSTGAGVHTIRLDGTDVSGSTDGATVTKNAILNLANFNGTTTNNTVMLLGSTSASNLGQIASGIGFTRESSANWGTQLRFYTHPTSTSDLDALDEVARFTTSEFVVNEQSMNYDFRVESDANSHCFFVNAAENQVTMGNTSDALASRALFVKINTYPQQNYATNASINYPTLQLRTAYATGGQTATQIDFRNGADAAVGTIKSTVSSTSYNTSSDQRLKENIVDAPSASDEIDAIQVRSFDWKANGLHQKYGMVAQELLTVAPDAVAVGDTEEDMMGVDYSKLVPMLIKEIQSLRARVADLES